MAERLFSFVQFEFPWVLGPADGRYVIRDAGSEQPAWIVALTTLGARERRRRRRPRPAPQEPEVELLATTRATVIDPTPLSSESQAGAWLREISTDEADRYLAVLNRVLHAHRIATADPHAGEVTATAALSVRGGYGEGEQVAEGLWRRALELPAARAARRPRRAAALRPQERLAALLGGRHPELVCEDLTLNVRLNLDGGRARQAALMLRPALDAALAELTAGGAPGRSAAALELRHPAARRGPASVQRPAGAHERLAELAELRPGVEATAQAALEGPLDAAQLERVEHALGRVEAALRARTAAGLA